MNRAYLEQICELIAPDDLFGGKRGRLRDTIRTRFPELPEADLQEIQTYLLAFYDTCVNYADILAKKYQTPFLPKGEAAEKEIAEYVQECRVQFPEMDAEKIEAIFEIVCWLTNR